MAVPDRIEKYSGRLKVAHKMIRLRTQKAAESAAIGQEFSLSPVASRVLAARGYRPDTKLKHYITPSLKESLPDPSALKNLDAACELITESIKNEVPIAICCDFDVDGLSGGAQVAHFLAAAGTKTKVFVPDRFEDGYGLNEKMIRQIAEQGFGQLIAIDYGTTNLKELSLARKLGVKTIVIDHHHVSEDPPADIFINPNQAGCGFAEKVLCASGLAWYLLVGLKRLLKNKLKNEIKEYLDLTCLGTICDMVPLIGANRTIAKRGLELMGQTSRVGLIALKNVMGLRESVSCSDISFGIGPRLNAAGRMVHGELVIELLTTADRDAAARIASRLNRLNAERQETENQVKEAAIRLIEERGEVPSGIAVWQENFHTGVIGIVAQRMVETFYRPAAVMGLDQEGIYKGSVRGIKGLSVVETLAAVSKYLIKFGGHEGAGGFSVKADKVVEFGEAFNDECKKRLTKLETSPYVDADTEVSLEEISIELVEELKKFAPFGMGNPNPVLLVKNLKVSEVRVLKDTHLKATLTDGRRYISGLMWRTVEHPALVRGTKVNVALKPEISTYGGLTEVNGHLQAVERA